MTMKIVFGFGAFLLCFSTVIANFGGSGSPTVGGCSTLSIKEAEGDEVQAGKQHILNELAAKVNCQPGYKVEVNLPGLQICKQVVAGTLYHYSWATEIYVTKCEDAALCENEVKKTKTDTKHVSCKASYWVKSWENFTEFRGINCKQVTKHI